jgi:hypothetical protein
MLNQHNPDAGVLGDCWRCCIASLLHLPASSVPNFVEDDRWWEATQAWLAERGLGMMLVDLEGCERYPLMPEGVLCIGSGPSPRGDWRHSVIVDEGLEVMFDPHPSRAGLAGPVETLEILVPARVPVIDFEALDTILTPPPECDGSGDCPWCRDSSLPPEPCPFKTEDQQ